MAAQKRKHDNNQLRGLFENHQVKVCPQCNQHTSKVKESRKVFDGVRRRYLCSSCNYRHTTFEISSDLYDELRQLRSKINKLQQIFLDVAPPLSPRSKKENPAIITDKIPCCDCVHLSRFGCTFDIPEAQSEAARGCNLFQTIISDSMLL